MGDEENTDESTIGLNLSSVPRKFGDGLRNNEKEINEDDLINNSDHFLLLGDPGSGKTTTVMRLARSIILKEPTSYADVWKVAWVFRLRECDKDIPLFNIFADEIGVTYEERPTRDEIRKEEKYGRICKQTYHVGNMQLHEFICQYLDNISCVLILDGLDEVENELRKKVEDGIQQIIHQTTTCKIIATCRSGDYKRPIPGIKVYEICP